MTFDSMWVHGWDSFSISWSVEGMFSSPRTGYWGIWQGATKSGVEGWLNNHVTCWATASWSLISLDHSNAEGAARKYSIIHCFSSKSHSVNPVFNFRFSSPERGVSTYILPQYPSWRNSISLLAAVSRSPPSSIFSDCLLLSRGQTFQSSKMSFFWLAFLYIIEWHFWDGLWDAVDWQMPSEGSVSSSLCAMSWLWCVPVRRHIVSSVSQPVTSGLLSCCSRIISVVSRRHAICDDGKLMMPQHACYSTPRSSFFLSCQLLSCRFLPRPLSSFLSGSLLFPPSNSTMNKWINQPEPLAGQHPRKKEWSRRQLPPWLTCRWSVKADHVGYPRKKILQRSTVGRKTC